MDRFKRGNDPRHGPSLDSVAGLHDRVRDHGSETGVPVDALCDVLHERICEQAIGIGSPLRPSWDSVLAVNG